MLDPPQTAVSPGMDDTLQPPAIEHQAQFTDTDVSSASLHCVIFLKLVFYTLNYIHVVASRISMY